MNVAGRFLRLDLGMCKGFARDLPGICQEYARDVPGICQRCARDVPGMCQRFVRDVPGICQGCARDLSGICQGCARDLSGICQGCARDLSGMCTAGEARENSCCQVILAGPLECLGFLDLHADKQVISFLLPCMWLSGCRVVTRNSHGRLQHLAVMVGYNT